MILLVVAGCKSPTHAESKVKAEQRWSQVRGQVKLQLARQQYERGRFDDAIKTLQEATALDPTSAEAYSLLAKANLELGKSTTAAQILDRAAKLGLETAELHYLQGVILEQRNEPAAALEQYATACSLDDTKVMYLIAQVETLVALDRPGEALALTDSNANQFDDAASVAILGARIAALMGDAQGALKRFQNPAIQNAGSRVATEELGALLASQGHCPEAIRALRPLSELVDEPEMSAESRRSLAECYLKTNDASSAFDILSGYAAAHPADRATQVLLAKAAIATGQYMIGLQAIEQTRQGNQSSPEMELLAAAMQWKRRDFTAAENMLEDILRRNPGDVDAWCLKGEVLGGQNRIQEAQEAFERALELDPDCRWAGEELRQMEGRFSPQKRAGKKISEKS